MRTFIDESAVAPRNGAATFSGDVNGAADAALLATVLDNLTQGIAVFGADLKLRIFNHRYVELFEYPQGFLKSGMTYEEIIRFNVTRGEYPGNDGEAHIHERLARAQTRGHVTTRHEHVRPNGTVIALRRAPVPGGGFINTYTDITIRKAAESEARRNAEILQATLDNMADGIRVFDKELKLLAWNKVAFDMFGFPDELARKGTPYSAFLDYTIQRGDYRSDPTQETLHQRLDRAKNPTVRKTEQLIPNGRYIQKRRRPLPGGGFVSTYFDVTDHKRYEEELARRADELAQAMDELKRSNDELQQFAYVASHDLQEPLRMVGSYCQLLQRRYQGKLGTDADEFIGYAVEGAKRMQRLINDLLLYSRVGTKGKPFARVALDEVLAEAKSNLTMAIEEAKAEIAADALPTVEGDAVQLTQLFQNLLGNALKFRDEIPVRIRISVERTGARWRISIRDNGIGIKPEYADRIFMIFQRLHTREQYPGTGIGLSICKKIVERHGGRISVEPAPDKGSIFTFTLSPSGGKPCTA